MHRTITGTTTKLSAAALVVVALAGCGSETADPGSGDATGGADGGFDVSAATLTDEPFCERIDTAAIGEVLGMDEDKVRTQVEREVGEEFQGPVDEAGPSRAVDNLCVFGSSTSQFVVSVQPDADAADVQKVVDELAGLTGDHSSESCESTDAAEFGDPSAAFTCRSGALERVRIVVTSLVGSSKFYCAAMMNQGAEADFADKTLQACSTVLEELASDA